jgi:hypothetical protein
MKILEGTAVLLYSTDNYALLVAAKKNSALKQLCKKGWFALWWWKLKTAASSCKFGSPTCHGGK